MGVKENTPRLKKRHEVRGSIPNIHVAAAPFLLPPIKHFVQKRRLGLG